MANIKANLIDIRARKIYPAQIEFESGKILGIQRVKSAANFILPGFVDAHIHIESSMLIPSEFARIAVTHGTIATVSDPHEIGNVCGLPGVEFMINNGQSVPMKYFFGAPSCVPATSFETAGAHLGLEEVRQLLSRPDIKYLSEMMNWPGVLRGDPEVIQKIKCAHEFHKPVDGHAPGLRGDEAIKYIHAGISTDHECFSYEEALFKLEHGMKILIREGSAARNYEALYSLIDQFPDQVMFCSDDKHPDELILGHINLLVRRSIDRGLDLFNVLQAACINPVDHYNLDVGLLREGDPADFIVLKDLNKLEVAETWINGTKVAENGRTLISPAPLPKELNHFRISKLADASGFQIQPQSSSNLVRVIEAIDGELITTEQIVHLGANNSFSMSDLPQDILKLVVVNRYHEAKPAVALIRRFGLNKGAIASSVAHDSHNIIAVGVDDESLMKAINLVIDQRGGLSAVGNEKEYILALPFGGLMTGVDGYFVAEQYSEMDRFVKSELGSTLRAPFMTLSFMALLVIPDLKLSDKGLFSGKDFKFVDLFVRR